MMNSRRVWARFIDDYRLLTAVTRGITSSRLWDTAIPAHTGSDSPTEFGLGPDYTIDTNSGNPFYFNPGSSYDVPFREGASRQLVGIRVISRSRIGRHRILLVRYGDLLKLASNGRSWFRWGLSDGSIVRIDIEPNVQEFGLLHSHLLLTCRNIKDSSTLLRVYDFTVYSRQQQARNGSISDRSPPYTMHEFPMGGETERLSDFRFAEDAILALVVSTLLT